MCLLNEPHLRHPVRVGHPRAGLSHLRIEATRGYQAPTPQAVVATRICSDDYIVLGRAASCITNALPDAYVLPPNAVGPESRHLCVKSREIPWSGHGAHDGSLKMRSTPGGYSRIAVRRGD